MRWLSRFGLLAVAALLVPACANEADDGTTASQEEGVASDTTLDEAALIESLATPIVYSDFASRAIYFVMTDRYANGDQIGRAHV